MATGSGLSVFERYLSLWVVLCIGAGIGLGSVAVTLELFHVGLEAAELGLGVGVVLGSLVGRLAGALDAVVLCSGGNRGGDERDHEGDAEPRGA